MSVPSLLSFKHQSKLLEKRYKYKVKMSRISTTLLLICSCLCGNVLSLALPSYIKACKIGPDFNECVVKVSNAAIPTVIKGDPQYKIPSFDPLVINEISVAEDNKKSISMNVTLTDAKLSGLESTVMTKANFDIDKKSITLDFDMPKVIIDSQYKIAGKFLLLPITGEGPAHIALDNVQLTFTVGYKLIKINGEDHIKSTNSGVKFEASKLQVDLKNLFNGDAALGATMNQALNDNWRELLNALGPSIVQEIGKVVINAIDEIARLVPYKEIVIQ